METPFDFNVLLTMLIAHDFPTLQSASVDIIISPEDFKIPSFKAFFFGAIFEETLIRFKKAIDKVGEYIQLKDPKKALKGNLVEPTFSVRK